MPKSLGFTFPNVFIAVVKYYVIFLLVHKISFFYKLTYDENNT